MNIAAIIWTHPAARTWPTQSLPIVSTLHPLPRTSSHTSILLLMSFQMRFCHLRTAKSQTSRTFRMRVIYLENIPDDEGLSLRKILAAWDGSQLTIHSCPSFNDTFLSWLRSEGVYTRLDSEGKGISSKMFPAEYCDSLRVKDCIDFTASALVDFTRFSNPPIAFLEPQEVDTDKPPHISFHCLLPEEVQC